MVVRLRSYKTRVPPSEQTDTLAYDTVREQNVPESVPSIAVVLFLLVPMTAPNISVVLFLLFS